MYLEGLYVDEGNEYYSTSDDHHVLYNFMKTRLILVAPVNLKSMEIPNTVNEICSDAFVYFPLESLTLPFSVSKYGYRSLGVCCNLKKIIIQRNIIDKDFLYYYNDQTSITEIWYYGTRAVKDANLSFMKTPITIYVCNEYKGTKFGTIPVTRKPDECPHINFEKMHTHSRDTKPFYTIILIFMISDK